MGCRRERPTLRSCAMFLSLLAPFGVVTAGEPEPSPSVYVYTNADLLRFADIEPAPIAAAAAEPEDWTSVTDFLEREYARLAAQQALDLERARFDREAERGAGWGDRYVLPWYHSGAYDRGYGGPGDGYRSRHGRRAPSVAAYGAHGIRPLHAGPTLAEIQRARAMRHRGSDAFPRRP